tara:strand:+ start:4510 stop:4758 length:249 start_codon:yes stop_codon:yes gene_type:complete
MSYNPVLSGVFTGIETTEISFNPENKNFLYGYYNIKEPLDRVKHLEDLTKRFNFKLNKTTGGLGKMIKDLKDDPFKFDKEKI